jgi:hypothetical protein
VATDVSTGAARARRRIGVWGTVARLLVGIALVGSVVAGHLRAFHPLPWVVGLVVLPGVLLGWQTLRARLSPGRMQATGPVAHLANRDDQIGCLLFLPIDSIERRRPTRRDRSPSSVWPDPGRKGDHHG